MKSGNPVDSPALIELLLHYHCMACPPRESSVNSEGTRMLLDYNLIGVSENPAGYITTARGMAHVEALCNLNIPEIRWVTPENSTQKSSHQ